MDRLVAAIDGGGTKTLAATADRSGNVKVFAKMAGCNPGDNPHWADGLSGSIAQFTPVMSNIEHITFGLPGLDEVPEFDAIFHHTIASLVSTETSLSNDVEIAHIGAFAGNDGVLLLAGTGSMTMTRTDGVFTRRGGWGDIIGDEGSGYWIGRRALSISCKMCDGRSDATPFVSAIRSGIGLSPEGGGADVLAWTTKQIHLRSSIAGVALMVDQCAEQGDRTAISLLKEAAAELFAHLAGHTPRRWSYAGSVFQSQILRAEVTDLIGKPPQPPVLPPLGGGLLLAAQKAGWDTGPDWVATLKRTIKG